MRTRGPRSGVTLIEVLVAVTLLALLSVGILFAMRVGLDALGRARQKLMANRRVAGAQHLLEQQIEGLMPVMAPCSAGGGGPSLPVPFFQGEPEVMRFVSSYSLQEAWRGYPRILEFVVIPRDTGDGVRLVVNEITYTGAAGAGSLCMPADSLVSPAPRFLPVRTGPQSFVLADKLSYCQFAYLEPAASGRDPRWVPRWTVRAWPTAVRINMASTEPDPSHLPVLGLTIPLHIRRSPDILYVDR